MTAITNSKDDKKEKVALRREIGLLEAVAITIGGVIGSGIFISPKGIVQHVGSIGASLLIWTFCGGLTITGAFCYAELACMFPSAGGAYTYIFESFGPAVAFMYLWVTIIVGVPLSNAILGLTFAKYIAQPLFPIGCEIPDLAIRLLSMSAIMVLTAINCMGVRHASRLINVFMYLKLFALGIIIVAGIYVVSSGQENRQNFENIWEGTNWSAESIVYSIFSGMFAFGGWTNISSMAEEMKEPQKNLPRAIFISLALVTAIYILTNVAYFTVLSPAEMLSSDAVAVTFFDKFWRFLVCVVPMFVACSTFGSLSIHIMTNARQVFQAARCGHFPSSFGLISVSSNTPTAAIIFMSLLTVLFMYTSDVFALINLLAIAFNLFQVVVYASSIYFRWHKPDMERPFKISIIFPVMNLVISLLFFVIPVYVQPLNAAMSVVLILPGLPIYYLIVARKTLPSWLQKIDESTTTVIQKLLMAVKED